MAIGACHHSPCPGVPLLGLDMKSLKIPAYQNNNSEDCPGQPAVRHFLYNPPNIINRFLLNFTIWRYFIKILTEWTQFHSDFASQPGHWGGSLSGSDLVVDLAELLLIRWIVLVDTGESPLYSSPPIASEMTHFQRVKRFLCAKTLKRFCYTLTPHILSWKFNLNKLKFSQFSIALSVLATSLPRR